MLSPEASKILAFETPKDLRVWLKANHAIETELWVKIYKKDSNTLSVTWNDVVIEVLCWGWIDGIKKSLNDKAYLQRITPRKRNSNWSLKNTKHVEQLIQENRMMESGLIHVRAAKSDGRWANAYSFKEMKVPQDFLNALENKPEAKAFFETLNKSTINAISYGLTSAKRSETRKKRFDKYMELLAQQNKVGFG